MRWVVLALAASLPAWPHAVSMSTGVLNIEGARAKFELRLPLYEAAHAGNSRDALLGAFTFGDARMTGGECREERSDESLRCTAIIEFAGPPEQVVIRSKLASVTVPNHIHVLRAWKDGARDQAVFDITYTEARLRFREPTAAERAFEAGSAGASRALGGAVQLVFLAALALAARSRRELMLLGTSFLAGQILSTLLLTRVVWQPPPRFAEAAAALTIAYLAVEVLFLPDAGGRPLVVGTLGAIHGLYLALFVGASEYHTGWVLSGAALTEAAAIALAGAAWLRLRVTRLGRPVERAGAAALLAAGLIWFGVRLVG